ncbi:MAG: sugar transferase [Planctomycetota bacterium]
MLSNNLRSTDEYSQLGRRRFGILLVDTPEMGGRAVVDRLEGLFHDRDIQVSIELICHDPNGFGGNDDSGDGLSGPVSRPASQRDVWNSHADEPSLPEVHPFNDSVSLSTGFEYEPDTDFTSPNGAVSMMDPVGATPAGVATIGGLKLISDDVETHSLEPRFLRYDSCQSDRSSDSDSSTLQRRHLPKHSVGKRLAKRSLDISGALIGLIAFSPMLAVAICLIRRQDGQPAIFKQRREGLDGKPFTIYKLRTMVADAEATQHELRALSHRDGPAFKISNDPRVTPIGDWLRRTCVDELPQLWNVLKGDMSLVGPRPLPWDESRACSQWQRRRLDVKPGMTCYWQVNKESVQAFDDWMRLDLRYVERFNLWEDLRLIARTVLVPLMGRGKE